MRNPIAAGIRSRNHFRVLRMLLLLLSQAYHENHQEKMAEIYRHKAEEELLKMKEVRMANPLFDE